MDPSTAGLACIASRLACWHRKWLSHRLKHPGHGPCQRSQGAVVRMAVALLVVVVNDNDNDVDVDVDDDDDVDDDADAAADDDDDDDDDAAGADDD